MTIRRRCDGSHCAVRKDFCKRTPHELSLHFCAANENNTARFGRPCVFVRALRQVRRTKVCVTPLRPLYGGQFRPPLVNHAAPSSSSCRYTGTTVNAIERRDALRWWRLERGGHWSSRPNLRVDISCARVTETTLRDSRHGRKLYRYVSRGHVLRALCTVEQPGYNLLIQRGSITRYTKSRQPAGVDYYAHTAGVAPSADVAAGSSPDLTSLSTSLSLSLSLSGVRSNTVQLRINPKVSRYRRRVILDIFIHQYK